MVDYKMKKDFFYLYNEAIMNNFVRNDDITMGNFATFIDYSFNKGDWQAIRKKLNYFLTINDKNNFNVIVVNGIFNNAIRNNFGNNIEKLKTSRMINYENNNLYSFNILYDDIYFPGWFKNVLEYKNLSTNQEVINRLLLKADFVKKQILENDCNSFTLNYFINSYIKKDNWIEIVDELFDRVEYDTINEMCWYITLHSYREYVKTLNELVENASVEERLEFLKEIQVSEVEFNIIRDLYAKKQLFLFNIIPKRMYEKLQIK
ncbi:MAG: hypothetical protein K0R54_651 [Clostridiaceae bacterium]|jgi:hypothetical protein|nr:hypothetical protein [Clostridiaceae bacterium]